MTVPILTIAPIGGLANRMRAILSAWTLATELKLQLHVVWLRNAELNCPYNKLFNPLPSGIYLHETTGIDKWIYHVPRKKNLYIPTVFQHYKFRETFFDKQLQNLLDTPEFIRDKVKKGNVFIASGLGFYPTDDTLFSSFFIPTKDILQEVGRRSADFRHVIGLHIRRTDNQQSIKGSPLSLFTEKMTAEIAIDSSVRFYLATDEESVKSNLQAAFPGRILYSPLCAERNSVEGMREAVIEMFTLVRTRCFYGSYYSSFSDLVLLMNPNGGEILHTEQ